MALIESRSRRAALALLLGVTACAGARTELEQVAKDWSRVVRASQVIPVYPLTEDLQPGDVFLVQLPIQRQQELYERDGFLPLDNHLARLDPSGYARFYGRAFASTLADGRLPGDLQRPQQSGAPWHEAPRSGFPTYSFSVRRGGGLNLALPVQAVPIGLALLGAAAAEGSISIGKARTLGIDAVSLYEQLQAWARQHADFLAPFGSDEPRNFLRVVTRVYLTGEVDVSLRAAEQRAGGVEAGQTSPLELLTATPPAAGETASAVAGYASGLEQLNEALQKVRGALAGAASPFAAGGSVRVTAASARSVALKEAFDPPLVIGYLGFDVHLARGGELGVPIPTHAVLQPDRQAPSVPRADLPIGTYETLRQAAQAGDSEAKRVVERLDALAGLLPADAPLYRTARGGALVRDRLVAGSDYPAFLQAWKRLQLTRSVLQRTLAEGEVKEVPAGGGTAVAVPAGSERWLELQRDLETIAGLLADSRVEDELQRARREAWAHLAAREAAAEGGR